LSTRNFVPRTNEEGNIGTSLKKWLKGWFKDIHVSGDLTNGTISTSIADLTKDLTNRWYVGVNGDFETIEEAVIYFNANATEDIELLLDTGTHSILNPIIVNPVADPKPGLTIRGTLSEIEIAEDIGGICFSIYTEFYIKTVTCTHLGSYVSGDDFIKVFESVYIELNDIWIINFDVGFNDIVGADSWIFNFGFIDCNKGIVINHNNPDAHSVDAEVGDIDNCAIGIDLLNADNHEFIIQTIVFNNSSSGVSVQYNGTDYHATNGNITQCIWNGVGSFFTGFDFTRADARDNDYQIFGNSGYGDVLAEAFISDTDNTSVTTLTTAGTYYKAVFTPNESVVAKFLINTNKITYNSNFLMNGLLVISGNLKASDANSSVQVAIKKNGTTIINPVTVRCVASNTSYTYSSHTKLLNIDMGDYFEIFLSSSTNTNDVILEDLNIYFEEK
jgi:hypothetical protein